MPSAAAPNVPAWKRLGLKLKSAQSTPEIATETSTLDSTKRKRSEDTQDNTPSKKSKKLSALGAPNPITPRLLERKKSVSFTPETKHEDGDSIKQLFNSWVSEQKSQDPSFDFKSSGPAFQVPEPPKVEEVVDTKLDEKERKVKRVKQPKKEKIPNKPGKPSKITKPVVVSARPFLQYLRQYSESKDTWKFNKNHQNHFIKSIFSLEAIPSDHAHFIYPYIHGLQGLVRTRLRDTAFAVKVQDEEEDFPADMANRDQKKLEYETAKANYVATMKDSRLPLEMGYEEGVLHNLSDKTIKQRAAKRIRAEQVLHELGQSPDARAVEEETRSRPNDGKVARKRKQRTVVDEDSSSSSDSSDSSDSDSESDDSSDDASGPKVARRKRDSGDSSSSSESSDSDVEMGENNDDTSSESDSSESSDGSGSDGSDSDDD